MSKPSLSTPDLYFHTHQKVAAWYLKKGGKPIRAIRVYEPLTLEDPIGKPIQVETGGALISTPLGDIRILSPKEFRKNYTRTNDAKDFIIEQNLPLEVQIERLYDARKKRIAGWGLHLIDAKKQIDQLAPNERYSVKTKADAVQTKADHGLSEYRRFVAAKGEEIYQMHFRTDISLEEKSKYFSHLLGDFKSGPFKVPTPFEEHQKRQKAGLSEQSLKGSTRPAAIPPFKIEVVEYDKPQRENPLQK